MPWGRTCDLVGVKLSEGTLAKLIERTAKHLEPVEEQIKAALRQAKVLHQDETGLYVKEATETARVQGQPCLCSPEASTFITRILALVDAGDQMHPRLPTPDSQRQTGQSQTIS